MPGRWILFAAALLLGCGDDGASEPARLIPPGDSDYATLELPESAGECTGGDTCEPNCLHACTAPGPVTCPMDPPPEPARLASARCGCVESVCAWQARPDAGSADAGE